MGITVTLQLLMTKQLDYGLQHKHNSQKCALSEQLIKPAITTKI